MIYRLPDLNLPRWISDACKAVAVMALMIAFVVVFLAVVLASKQG